MLLKNYTIAKNAVLYQEYIDGAKTFETEGKIDNAIALYEKALEINTACSNCKQQIENLKKSIETKEYKELLIKAEMYETKGFYPSAIEVYQKAGTYSIADKKYLLAKEEELKIKTASPTIVRNAEETANLAYKKRDYDECFAILSRYETSGLLTGKSYYRMGSILNGNYGGVARKFFDGKRCRMYFYSSFYLKRSMSMGYSKASELWDTFTNKNKNRKIEDCD